MLLFAEREHAENTIDRLAGVDRVERAQNQVTCLRCHQCDFDRGTIAHFAHENDFRRLPQRRPQAVGIVVKILAQLALVECRLKTWMNELNRIFQRDDVDRLRLVNFIEHRRQSGGFTAAGRTGDEHEPGFLLRDLPENDGEMKCFQGGNGGFKPTQNDRKISALPENINAKARLVAQRIAKVARTAA